MKKLSILFILIIISQILFAQQDSLNNELFKTVRKYRTRNVYDFNKIQQLINKGADVNAEFGENNDPLLFYAVKWRRDHSKDIQLIEFLVENGADINAVNNLNNNALYYSADTRNLYVARYLLEKGIHVNNKNSDNRTALHNAAERDGIVEILLKNNADPDIQITGKEFKGWTALMLAGYKGHMDEFQALLDAGADTDIKNADGKTVWEIETYDKISLLHHAFRHKKIVKLLLEKGFDPNLQTEDGSTPLMYAGRWGNIDVFQLLLDTGADITIKNNKGKAVWELSYEDSITVLHYAAREDNTNICKILVETGADVNAKISESKYIFNNPGFTPLLFAIQNYNHELVEYFIENSVNVNDKFREESDEYPLWTALHFAAKQNNLNSVLTLVNNNADKEALTKNGYTASDIAKNYGSDNVHFFLQNPKKNRIFALYKIKHYKEMYSLLKQDNSLLNYQNQDGKTLLHLCITDSNTDVLKKLLKFKPDLNVKDKTGETILFRSVLLDKKDFVRLLISKGSDVNIPNNDGYTSLYIAKKNKNKIIEELLIDKGAKQSNINAKLILPVNQAGNFYSVLFTADNTKILSGSEKNIKLWDIETGKEIKTYIGHKNRVYSTALSPDGTQMVSGSLDKTIKLWDVSTGIEIRTFIGHTERINSVAFSPDGTKIISCSGDGTIKLWDVTTGNIIKTFICDKYGVTPYAFSPDNTKIIYGFDKTIKLWDIATGKEIKTYEGHTGNITSIAFSPDGTQIVSCSRDETIKLWDVASGNEIKAYKGNKDKVYYLSFSSDGINIISSSAGNTFKFRNVYSGKEKTFKEYSLKSAVLSSDGTKIISGSMDKTIKLWDIETGHLIKTFKEHANPVTSISKSSDEKKLLFNTKSRNKIFWDVEKGLDIKTYENYYNYGYSIDLSPDGTKMISDYDNRDIKLWDIKTGDVIKTFNGISKWNKLVVFSPDGTKIISESINNTLRLWDITTGKVIKTFFWEEKNHKPNDGQWIKSLAFSRDGTRITACLNKNIRLWNIETGKEIRTFRERDIGRFYDSNYVSSAAISDDGKRIISGSENYNIILWDADTGKNIKTFKGHTDNVNSLVFSSDGSKILSASSDNNIKLWDVKTGKEIRTFKGHMGNVNSAVFFKDETKIISGSSDNSIKLWDISTGKELISIIATDSTNWVVYSPTGLFDATPGAMDKMHYVVGQDIIELNQLKDRYYEPGLLRKIIKGEELRDVHGFNNIKLPPHIELLPILHDKIDIKIKNNQTGGIGHIQVFVNGKEIIDDARRYSSIYKTENDLKIIKEKDSIRISIDITGFERYLLPNEENIISVSAYNGENYIISRPKIIKYTPAQKDVYNKNLIPDVYILSIGTSEYYNSGLNLRFAAKDARDIATSLQIAANRLFGEDKVHTYLFTSPLSDEMKMINGEVTINNFKKVFEQIGYDVTADDIVIVYLAGHGMNIDSEGDGGDFYYLTQDAHSNEFSAYSDFAVREKETLAGSDIIKLMNKLPANKQVLIIDACHSGKAVENLMASRNMSSGTIRALDRMRDRTGMHIITGSTADAVSYESNQFGQGILTYSLLEGLKGASLKESKFVDVMLWFQRAKNRVPDLASGLGGIQDPVIFSPYIEGKFKEGAESFEIGELNSDDKKLIPLASSKPIFVLSLFQDAESFDDHLDLSENIDEKFRELTAKGSDAPLILIETRNFPSAYKLRGQYKVTGDKINLKANLFKGKDLIKSFEFTGNKNEINVINQKIINEILSMKI